MFSESEIDRSVLIKPCAYWLKGMNQNKIAEVGEAVLEAFDRWQKHQVDSNGNVRAYSGYGGLLATPVVELLPRDEVEPWRSGGPYIRNNVDLAFMLWLESDTEFAAVIERHTLAVVFSFIALWCQDTSAIDSLVRLNGLLVNLLAGEATFLYEDGRKKSDELTLKQRLVKERVAVATAESARQRTEAAVQDTSKLRKAAIDYIVNGNPAATLDEVVRFIKERCPDKKASTIKRLLSGVLKEGRAIARANASKQRPDIYSAGRRGKL